MGLLSVSIWLPILAGTVLLAIGRDENAQAVRWLALVAASVLDLTDALRLTRRRGELMQEAVPAGTAFALFGAVPVAIDMACTVFGLTSTILPAAPSSRPPTWKKPPPPWRN